VLEAAPAGAYHQEGVVAVGDLSDDRDGSLGHPLEVRRELRPIDTSEVVDRDDVGDPLDLGTRRISWFPTRIGES
jgi:hypothetical protein